jgi:hypothetical protein
MKSALTVAALAFGATQSLAAQNACTFNALVCVESTNLDVSSHCTEDGGIVSTDCAGNGRYATCEINTNPYKIFVRYYQGYPEDTARQNCAESGGQFSIP